MVTQMRVSNWSLGRQRVITIALLDKGYNVVEGITYPITYSEACNWADWATARARKPYTRPYMAADGWNIYIPIAKVIDPDCKVSFLHQTDRREPEQFDKYVSLNSGKLFSD